MSIHEICVATTHTRCYCDAAIGEPCTSRGVHYARVSRACQDGEISLTDFGEAIHDDVFTGGDILLDPAAVTS